MAFTGEVSSFMTIILDLAQIEAIVVLYLDAPEVIMTLRPAPVGYVSQHTPVIGKKFQDLSTLQLLYCPGGADDRYGAIAPQRVQAVMNRRRVLKKRHVTLSFP